MQVVLLGNLYFEAFYQAKQYFICKDFIKQKRHFSVFGGV